MVDEAHPQLSVRRQCELLAVNRNRLKVREAPRRLFEKEVVMAHEMDECYMHFPEYGARRMQLMLSHKGFYASRRTVARIMREVAVEAIYRKPRTRQPRPGAQKCPYLLRDRLV